MTLPELLDAIRAADTAIQVENRTTGPVNALIPLLMARQKVTDAALQETLRIIREHDTIRLTEHDRLALCGQLNRLGGEYDS
jgi:hypothetical protein